MTVETPEQIIDLAHRLAMLDGSPVAIMNAAIPLLARQAWRAGHDVETIARWAEALAGEFGRIVNGAVPVPPTI